jgi:hypothetical protein
VFVFVSAIGGFVNWDQLGRCSAIATAGLDSPLLVAARYTFLVRHDQRSPLLFHVRPVAHRCCCCSASGLSSASRGVPTALAGLGHIATAGSPS